MKYEEDLFTKTFIKDMQAFEAKYPGVHLVIEVNEDTNDQYRVEHKDQELFFETYEDVLEYLKIYD